MVGTLIQTVARLSGAWIVAFLLLGVGWALAVPVQEPTAEPIGVFVQLADEPTALVFSTNLARSNAAQATVQAQAQLQRIEAAQRTLLTETPLASAQVLYRVQRVYNGIALRLDPAFISQVRALPGVIAVHPLPVHTVDTARAVPFLGAPQLWDQVYSAGLTGESISIGIIDTGIDYLHRNFGGPGRGYSTNNPEVITDVVAGITFPTLRVVGGYDFAGDSYDVRPGGNAIPRPDPDPMDCWGHGTHVAGIAGGSGLLRQGSATYTGTYTSGLSFAQFTIGPGIAPRADLYALKVFGCGGASNLVPVALEWAVDPNRDGDFSDHLDVVNLSVGSPYGSYNDPSSIAADNASLAGVIVVAAGGNSGDSYYAVNSPGVADRTISVAATSIGGLVGAEASAEPAAAVDTLASFSARGPRRGDSALKPEIAAPGVAINSASQGTGTGTATLSGTSMATPFVAGAAALLHQLHPSWTVEEIKALLMNTARYNVTANDSQPPLLYSPARAGAGRLDIDAARRADLLVFNASDPGLVGLSFGSPAILGEMSALKNVRLVNKSPLSRTLYMDYVPIVDMPGVSFTVLGGSTRQLLPYSTLNVAVLLSAQADQLSNVADPTVAPKGVFPRHWLGEESGFLYVWPQQTRIQAQLSGANLLPPLANRITGLLDGSLAPDTGRLTYALTLTATEPITISSATLHLGQFHVNGPLLFPLPVTSLSGATPLTVTGAVTLTREMLSLLAAGGVYLQIGDVAHPNGAARGQLKPMDVVLRLPVYAAPRPTSAMRAQTTVLNYGSVVTGVQTLQLIGQGLLSVPTVQQAAFPTDTISLATALELQFSSPNEDTSSGLLNHADLKYVGIGSDWEEADDPAQTKLLFGLATYDNWSSPNEVLFRIHIDVDQNGEADFVLRSGNGSEFNLAASKDEFIAVLEDVRTGVRRPGYFRNLVSSAEFNTAVFNNSVALLAVSAGDIGLTTAQSSFVYSITTHSLDTEDPNTVIDRSPLLTYDVQNPGVQVEGLGNLPIFYDLPNTKIAVTANRNALVRNRSNGVVIMHFHNDIGERTEKVDLRFEMSLYLPQILGTQAAK